VTIFSHAKGNFVQSEVLMAVIRKVTIFYGSEGSNLPKENFDWFWVFIFGRFRVSTVPTSNTYR
jgi:hypothetical protein